MPKDTGEEWAFGRIARRAHRLPRWAWALPLVAAAEITVLVLAIVSPGTPTASDRISGALGRPALSGVASEPPTASPVASAPSPSATSTPVATAAAVAASGTPSVSPTAAPSATATSVPTPTPQTSEEPVRNDVSIETVIAAGSVAPSASGGARDVRCPSGYVAIGGGVEVEHSGSWPYVVGSSPLPPGSTELLDLDDGTHAAPTGWRGEVHKSAGATGAGSFAVAVVCAKTSGVKLVVRSGTAGTNAFAGLDVTCPAGSVASGGGVQSDPAGNVPYVVASAPELAGKDRLFDRSPGTYAEPRGWRGDVHNVTGSGAKTFKVAVVCTELVGVRTAVDAASVAPGGGSVNLRVGCPAGWAAAGGGIDQDTSSAGRYVGIAAPSFQSGEITEKDPGTYGYPSGWIAQMRNGSAAKERFVTAAVCAPV